jgi:hypothetical protein
VAEKLGAMQMHLSLGKGVLEEDIEQSQAFLENREPRPTFGEPPR